METFVGVMDTIGLVITVVFLVFILLSGGLMLLNGRKRHWIMSLARLGIVILSAIIAVPVSQAIAGAFSGQLCHLILSNLGADVEEFIDAAPMAAESVSLLISLVFVPILFIFVFILIRGLLAVVAWIVEKAVPFFRTKPVYNLAISLPVGAITGFLFAIVVILPLCGTLALGTDAIDAGIEMSQTQYDTLKNDLKETKKERDEYEEERKQNGRLPGYDYGYWYEEEAEEVIDYDAQIDDIENSMDDLEKTMDLLESVKVITDGPVTGTVATCGAPLFRWMTSGSMEYEGQKIKISLTEDIPAIADSVSLLAEAAQGIADGDVTGKDKKELENALEDIMEFDMIACIMADSVEYVSNLWLKGESFMGISCPDMGEILQPVYNTALQVMADSDMETMREDILTIADVLTDLIAAGITGGNDYEDMMASLAEDDLLNEIVKKLEKNRHMQPIVVEVKNLSVRLVASAMGDLLKDTDQYDPMIGDVAKEMTRSLSMDAETRHSYLESEITRAFAENDIQVPETVAVEMAEQAIAELGEDGVVEKQELKDYYINFIESDDLGDNLDDIVGA